MSTPSQVRRRYGYVAVGLLAGLLILLVIAAIGQTRTLVGSIRHQQQSNVSTLTSTQQAARDAARTARLVKSCVDPDGQCFKDAQSKTAAAVASINQVVVLAAACAVDQHGTVAHVQTAIQTCVINRLALTHAKH